MAPVYLLAGDDDLLLQRETERLVSELREADPELDVETHDASELERLPELRTASLFGGRTGVVIRGVEGASGALRDELDDYLAAPSDEAVMVLVARGTGRIQRLARLAKEHGERRDVKRPADWDDRGWQRLVGDEFRRAGRTADAGAIAAILLHAGSDPGAIASKVAQTVAAAPGQSIAADDVERAVEGHGRQTGFAVADAIAERDPAGALIAARGALEAGEAPLALLGAITFRLRQLLRVRGGASAKEAGVSAGQHRRLQAIAQRFGPGELAWCHDRAASLDLDLKGSELPDEVVLEIGIVELASAREVGAPFNPLAAR